MATFNPQSKSSQSSFTTPTKDTDTWQNVLHSDIAAGGMDVQVMDSTVTGMDDAGNTIVTAWAINNKETG